MEKITDNTLVRVESLKKYFSINGGLWHAKKNVRAVDDVSFDIREGETLGLVGESGCGKSTLGRAVLGLLPVTGGRILFEGEDIAALRGAELKSMRKKMQLIFQDPSACLNPRKTVRAILEAPFKIHRMGHEDERIEKICALLENVGLSKHFLSRYPHEMSGGQKQRVSIARAIALRPKLVVCDEAVSALDVSIQAQVINLLEDLQSEFSLTYMFISHNLSVVHHISDRVGVMYLGRIVELASKKDLFENTLHPYSKALISAIPEADPEKKRSGGVLSGDVPSPADPPSGCGFHTRCPEAADICRRETPALLEKTHSHLAACHLL
jgi:peptide/nickel transport system ATP-binding protein/oligopeptide transport system ATP-binding protein